MDSFTLRKQRLTSNILLPRPASRLPLRGLCLTDPTLLLCVTPFMLFPAVLFDPAIRAANITAFVRVVFRHVYSAFEPVAPHRQPAQ